MAILNNYFNIKINQIFGSYLVLIILDTILILSSILIIESKFDLLIYLILLIFISLFFLIKLKLDNLSWVNFSEIIQIIKNILKHKVIFKIMLISIIKFLLLALVIQIICLFLNFDFDLKIVLIFSFFQNVLDIIKITPGNLFVGEYIFSLITKFSLFNSLDGVILKIFYRLFENLSYLTISFFRIIKNYT